VVLNDLDVENKKSVGITGGGVLSGRKIGKSGWRLYKMISGKNAMPYRTTNFSESTTSPRSSKETTYVPTGISSMGRM
jgi:hypothetical protein